MFIPRPESRVASAESHATWRKPGASASAEVIACGEQVVLEVSENDECGRKKAERVRHDWRGSPIGFGPAVMLGSVLGPIGARAGAVVAAAPLIIMRASADVAPSKAAQIGQATFPADDRPKDGAGGGAREEAEALS